jgi:dynein heavy chain
MFPSLVNCTTIDWFSVWPEDALVACAKHFLSKIEMEPEVLAQCQEMCQFFHMSTIKWSDVFLKKLKRNYYVTPTSYLELITTFRNLLKENRETIKKG